jgi:hypothetical protein
VQPVKTPVLEQVLLEGSDGREYPLSASIPDLSWCPPQTWRPGSIVQIGSRTFNVQNIPIPNGLAQMSIALLPQTPTSSTIGDVRDRMPLQILNAPDTILVNQKTHILQLMPLKIVN